MTEGEGNIGDTEIDELLDQHRYYRSITERDQRLREHYSERVKPDALASRENHGAQAVCSASNGCSFS
jgi:hypothetical protein